MTCQKVAAIKLIVGTCRGSRADARAIAKSMIDRYFDAPEICRFYLKVEKGVGVHYEIQQGGEGRAYLPSILQALGEDRDDITLATEERQVKIWRRSNGDLFCLWLASDDEHPIDVDGLVKSGPRMTRHTSSSGAMTNAGRIVFLAGALVLGAGVLNQAALTPDANHLGEIYAERFAGPEASAHLPIVHLEQALSAIEQGTLVSIRRINDPFRHGWRAVIETTADGAAEREITDYHRNANGTWTEMEVKTITDGDSTIELIRKADRQSDLTRGDFKINEPADLTERLTPEKSPPEIHRLAIEGEGS
ncbi:hypothetical protein VRRI112168_14920 [Vreelandella rituensis]|uniref:Uncharacterized protein n=1 Tax=Vreelandella rituensis TaxID=2282306 RepID=A0A368U9Y2_9GAMM|nr:hypothetical protein [Halomonas rituensis]RCV93785.1 hypothetical protein DU506_01110 [Halomonas rituensis]